MRVSLVLAMMLVVGSTSDAQTLTNPNATTTPSLLPGPNVEPPAATAATGPVSLSEVVSMSKAGLDDDVIIDLVRQRGPSSSLTVDQLIYLRQQGVSNEVIKAMQTSSAKTWSSSSTTPAQTVAPTPSPTTVAPAPPAPAPVATTTYQVQPPQTVIVQQPPVIVRPYPAYYWGPSYYPCYEPAYWNFGYHGGHHGGHHGHSHWSFGVGGW